MGRKKTLGCRNKCSRAKRQSLISPKWVTLGEYNDNLIIKCKKVKKSSSFLVFRKHADDLNTSIEISKNSSSWDIVGEYNDNLYKNRVCSCQ